MDPCHTKESSLLHAALTEKELELTPDGRYIRWASSNPRHPRNWHPLRKAYDIAIIILLEFYTWVALFHADPFDPANSHCPNSTAVSTSGVSWFQP